MKYTEVLKPCPFCNEEEIQVTEIHNPTVWWDSNMRGEHCAVVYCCNCNAMIKENRKEDAIELWNTRKGR